MAGGRPSLYTPDFAKQAIKLCELGATNVDLADAFEVTVRTIERWAVQHEEFCRALKTGKEAADDRVERSLYNRAVGYTFDSEKILTLKSAGGEGVIERVKIKEHVPPDVTAQIFWLKNRRKDQWRDKHEVGVTNQDGEDVIADPMEAVGRILFGARKAKEAETKDGGGGQ